MLSLIWPDLVTLSSRYRIRHENHGLEKHSGACALWVGDITLLFLGAYSFCCNTSGSSGSLHGITVVSVKFDGGLRIEDWESGEGE